jgi:hypothetical protein
MATSNENGFGVFHLAELVDDVEDGDFVFKLGRSTISAKIIVRCFIFSFFICSAQAKRSRVMIAS